MFVNDLLNPGGLSTRIFCESYITGVVIFKRFKFIPSRLLCGTVCKGKAYTLGRDRRF